LAFPWAPPFWRRDSNCGHQGALAAEGKDSSVRPARGRCTWREDGQQLTLEQEKIRTCPVKAGAPLSSAVKGT